MKKFLALLALLLAGPVLAAPTPYPGIGQIFGVYTFATLPSPSSLAIGTFAYTSDDGYCYTNGVTWVIIGLSGGGSGTVTSVALTVPSFLSVSGSPVTTAGTLAISLSGTALPIANGGTGTASPGLVAGTNVTITGSWPDQTINASGGGSSAFNSITSGTNTTAAMVVGTGASLATSGSGTIAATNTTGVNGAAVPASQTCVGTNSSSQIVTASCSGSSAFSSITSGTNTAAAMVVSTGASLNPGGTGVVNANQINGAVVPASAALLGSNSSSQTAAVTTSGCFNVTSTVASVNAPINAQTGTTYTILTTDACKLVTFSNAASIAVTLPVATTSGFGANFSFDVQNIGVGLVTITTSTINGATTLTIATNRGCTITSDGTNYQVSACTAITVTTTAINNVGGAGTSITPSCAVEDNYGTMTATGGTFTVNAATGCTQTEGQKLLLHLKFTNSQTYSWNSAYVGGTTALPTTSTGTSKGDWVGFRWDSINSKWDYLATATGF